ncbi:MAG: hypothetical protein QXP55_04600 [Nitrososphaerales archaeon]
MPTCPTCHSKVTESIKTWSIVEPGKNGEIIECVVGIYWCTKCKIKFPYVVGKYDLRLIEKKELVELYEKIKMLDKVKQDLVEKVNQLEKEKIMAEGSLFLTKLENKAENLKVEVSLLKEVKREIESMIEYLENTPYYELQNRKSL